MNASNTPKDVAWAKAAECAGAAVEDESPVWAQLALQGPRAETILQTLTETPLARITYYRFEAGKVLGVPALLSRTGYTGEDGFEVYLHPDHAGDVWDAILKAGQPHGILPAGLGARDTLRLEACLALYGNDIDDAHTPWEANLGWIVKMKKGDFTGARRPREAEGGGRHPQARRLRGHGPRHRAPRLSRSRWTAARASRDVRNADAHGRQAHRSRVRPRGEVRAGHGASTIDVRGRGVPAVVVPTPFYRHK